MIKTFTFLVGQGCRSALNMKFALLFLPAFLLWPGSLPLRAASVLRDFVTARGGQLMEAAKPFRFISFDIPNLQLIEDNVPFAQTNPWRWPDQFELTDALSTVRQMGGTVVRTYVISVMRPSDPPGTPRHVLGPGRFNEEAFRALDLAFKVANEQGIRLIIPLVDNWAWQGGRADYAAFRGKSKDDFWTDPQLIADFKETIRFILTRKNTRTGTLYSDDKALLCWETGNELQTPPPAWTRDIAAFIKSLDHHHLVMDGTDGRDLHPELIALPGVDIVTTHHYPSGGGRSFAQLIRANWALAKGKKPYVVGEFGFVSTAQMQDAMQAIMETGTSGGLLWSLRFRNRDGGFYWHSEPGLGGDKYKAFHWPGSSLDAAYDEMNLMAAVRRNAFAIRGLTPPPIAVPAPPNLLPIRDAAAISWQGSVGAASYTVERAPRSGGPWTVAGDGIEESFIQYRPLFADESVPRGDWFYRVRAKNAAGSSAPSNIAGPVKVTCATLVDELENLEKVCAVQGKIVIKTNESRKAKEDAHRAAGNAGDALTYRLPTPIQGFRVFAFFPHEVAHLKFSLSADGRNYQEVQADKNEYFQGAGDYNYWKPVLYHADDIGSAGNFLRIEMAGETQIGRVEIMHGLGNHQAATTP
jgi:hypothetical protein